MGEMVSAGKRWWGGGGMQLGWEGIWRGMAPRLMYSMTRI